MCLEVHLANKIKSLVKVSMKKIFSQKNDHFKTAILSDLEEIVIDKEGRLLLKINLKNFQNYQKKLFLLERKSF